MVRLAETFLAVLYKYIVVCIDVYEHFKETKKNNICFCMTVHPDEGEKL